ncbi:MAG: tol-pal system protein YbgF [Gammaproteobacteria bacterium]
MRALIAGGSLIGIAGCTSLSPADDPMYLRLTDMEARLIRIERVLENESIIQLAGQIDELRNETQLLRGEIETLQFASDNSAERQRDLYVDLDARLQSLETNQVQTVQQLRETASRVEQTQQQVADVNSQITAPPIPIGSDQDNYNAAFDLIQSRQYGDAAAAFQSFLRTFPESPLADNAQYWLAETYYVQRQFADALPQFQRVLDDYPQSAKLPDALLKIGYCNYELQNLDAARAALEQVSRQFPDTTAARLAVQRIERIIQETG